VCGKDAEGRIFISTEREDAPVLVRGRIVTGGE
jgi:hypothetical protein